MSVATLPTRLGLPRGGQRTAVYVEKRCQTCEGIFLVREKSANKVANCGGCRVYKLPAAGGWCVATRELGPWIDKVLTERDQNLRKAGMYGESEDTGVLEAFAQDVAATLGLQQTAAIRRLYAVRNFETRAVKSEFADACLLAGGVLIEEQEDIRVFPSTVWAAKEMETIDAEERGETLDKETLEQRARVRLEAATREVLALDHAVAA